MTLIQRIIHWWMEMRTSMQTSKTKRSL
uniref:Uncharacterized protein n=1 Tax=Anguilla anguilla TaxID=7936 RepID=A0A0E9Y0S5_ANGAN